MRFRVTSALLACLAAAGCNGNDDGPGQVIVTPTPTPSTPTPTPTDPQSAPFDYQTVDRQYAGTCAGYIDATPNVPYWYRRPVHVEDPLGTLSYLAETKSYSLKYPGLGITPVGPYDLLPDTPAGTISYERAYDRDGPFTLSIIQPSPGGSPFVYGRLLSTNSPAVLDPRGFPAAGSGHCVVGVQTASAIQSADFTQFGVAGKAFDARSGQTLSYDLSNSEIISAKITNGTLNIKIRLIGLSAGSQIELGDYTFDNSANAEEGDMISSNINTHDPTIDDPQYMTNAFIFGPNGEELGYIAQIYHTIPVEGPPRHIGDEVAFQTTFYAELVILGRR